MKREISAGAIIFREEKNQIFYLLLHYQAGHWGFVKGNIEKDESIEETIKREAKEEAGIKDLQFIEGFKETIKYIYTWPPKDPKAERIFKIVIFRLAKTNQKEITLSYEHIGFDWLPYEEAQQRLAHNKALLTKAHQFLTKKDKK